MFAGKLPPFPPVLKYNSLALWTAPASCSFLVRAALVSKCRMSENVSPLRIRAYTHTSGHGH